MDLVDVTEFPEEDEQFLVELDAFTGPWQVGLQERVVQQASHSFQYERKVLHHKQR